ncbi:MAG TPA: hypothetical protein VEI02_09680, partial [Planctomycetota bacterium]|nr:hypothetical protein [Planctomycetota bacterium]
MPDFTADFGVNAAWVADLFARWTADPRGVPEDWSDYFSRLAPEKAHVNGASTPAAPADGAAATGTFDAPARDERRAAPPPEGPAG